MQRRCSHGRRSDERILAMLECIDCTARESANLATGPVTVMITAVSLSTYRCACHPSLTLINFTKDGNSRKATAQLLAGPHSP